MKTICVDFDGVIHDYSKGWRGVDVFDKPIEGAKECLELIKAEGYTIIIFTTRKDTPALRKFLDDNGITYDYINENPNQPADTSNKIIADVYLDDRAIRFNGNWSKALYDIRKLK